MAPTYAYSQLKPVCVPAVTTSHRTHTDGNNHVIETFFVPWNCVVRSMRYQITVGIVNPTTAAVLGLAVGDRDGTRVADIDGSQATLASGTAAADTIYEVIIPGGQAVTAGDSILCQVHTAGVGAGLAGEARVWAVVQPSEM